MISKIWINTSIFKEGYSFIVSANNDLETKKRIYDIWKSSEEAIKDSFNLNENSYNRNKFEQGYLSLKRAYNLRVKQLNKTFGFSQINYSEKRKGDGILEILEHFNVVKKNTLKKYLEFRNDIEHKDRNRLTYDFAVLQVDYIWMFLKVTDLILNKRVEIVVFQNRKLEEVKFVIQLKFNIIQKSEEIYKMQIELVGLIEPKNFSFLPKNSWVEINNVKLLSNNEFLEHIYEEFQDIELINRKGILFQATINNEDLVANLVKKMINTEGDISEFSENEIYEVFRK